MGSRNLSQERGANASERASQRRKRWYFLLMAVCIVLFVGAWALVRLWSVPAAIGMCVVAMVIPPVAVIVGNRRTRGESWWDEEENTRREPPHGFDDRQ